MKPETYTQCIMHKGAHVCTSWIPSEFAQVGRVLCLKNDGVWDDGWTVKEVGKTQDAKYVLDHERDYLKQRIASDI